MQCLAAPRAHTACQVRGFDPEQLVGALAGCHIEHCPVGVGALEGERLSVPLASMHVDAGSYSESLLLRGRLSETCETTLLLLEVGSGARINSIAVRAGDVIVCRPGARLCALLVGPSQWVAIQTPAEPSTDAPVTTYRPTRSMREQSRARADEFVALARRLSPAGEEGRLVARAATRLGSAVCCALESGVPRTPDASPASVRRRAMVRAASAHLESHLEEAVTTRALCAIVRASRRTLDHAFNTVLGVAPITYHRALRFAAARKVLLRPECPRLSVTSVAMRFGFFHLGRFSVEYRERFQESPSESVARPDRLASAV